MPIGGTNGDDYFTLKEAARVVGMSKRWLWNRLKRKNAPPFKRRGSVYLFPRDEFQKWNEQKIIK